MADYSAIAIYALLASIAVYAAILMRKNSAAARENLILSQAEKIAEYFSSTGSIQKALQQLVQEQPSSTLAYSKILQKIGSNVEASLAFEQAAAESQNKLFAETCIMIASAIKKNDANALFQSVQKLKDAANLSKVIGAGSEMGSFILQFVFAIIIPLIYFFMITTLGFQSDVYLEGFLGAIVVFSALFQGVVFRQWVQAMVKIPMVLSVFYLLFFVLAPKFIGGILGSIV